MEKEFGGTSEFSNGINLCSCAQRAKLDIFGKFWYNLIAQTSGEQFLYFIQIKNKNQNKTFEMLRLFGFKKWCMHFSFPVFYIQILNLNIEKKALIFIFNSVWYVVLNT